MKTAPLDIVSSLAQKTDSKILLIVLDGLGDLTRGDKASALEAASCPNLDELAAQGTCGLQYPVARGITPGSGPGHLSLFGYDPFDYLIGRGALSAAGIGILQRDDEIAARANLATMDSGGNITDRRAGRVPTEVTARMCELLNSHVKLDGIAVRFAPEKDYRAVVMFRGEGLSDRVSETDSQKTGAPSLPCRSLDGKPASARLAAAVNELVAQANRTLAKYAPTNTLLLRGFSGKPQLPQFKDLYQLDAAAVAVYPMYRGLAALAGMRILPTGSTMADEAATLKEHWQRHDFFFMHVKWTDSAGEDGNLGKKIAVIEEFDRLLPDILALKPDVIAVTGDHSTPAAMAGHSFHGVPILISSKIAFEDNAQEFNERSCSRGMLGHIHGTEILPLLLAHAGKLGKYGA